MPFGLTSDPRTFQQIIGVILASVKQQYALVVLDGIMIFLKTFEGHIEYVPQVPTLLQRASVTLELKRHCCYTNTID